MYNLVLIPRRRDLVGRGRVMDVCRPCGRVHERGRHDAPSHIALCRACAVVVVPVGRHAPLLCRRCADTVRALDADVPLGPHTFANGVTLDPDAFVHRVHRPVERVPHVDLVAAVGKEDAT